MRICLLGCLLKYFVKSLVFNGTTFEYITVKQFPLHLGIPISWNHLVIDNKLLLLFMHSINLTNYASFDDFVFYFCQCIAFITFLFVFFRKDKHITFQRMILPLAVTSCNNSVGMMVHHKIVVWNYVLIIWFKTFTQFTIQILT